MSASEFVNSVVEGGLLSRDDIEEIRARLVQQPTVEHLVKKVVEAGKLSPFQARMIYAGRGKS